MIEIFDRYFDEHKISSRPFKGLEVCRQLRWKHQTGCAEYCDGWNLVEGVVGDFTLVYQFNRVIENYFFEEAWKMVDGRYRAVQMTTGDIEGLPICGEFPRLYVRAALLNSQKKMDALMDGLFVTMACAVNRVWFYYAQAMEGAFHDTSEYEIYTDSGKLSFIEQNICPLDELANKAFDACFKDEELEGEEDRTAGNNLEGQKHQDEWMKGDGNGFEDLAGMDSLKTDLSDSVLWTITHREKAEEYNITPPNGMLLYGPPGCGKTYFAKKFAEEAGCSYKVYCPSDLANPYVHGTQGKIAQMFAEAEEHAPCVICLDEVDAMIPVRSDNPSAACKNDEVNEFLARLNNCGDKGIYVIGTTNKKELIDPAALRKGRFDVQVEIPVPDYEQRRALFVTHLKKRPVAADVDIFKLARMTDGCVAADIAYIINEAALACARKGIPISQEALETASGKIKSVEGTVRRIGFRS